MSKAIDDFHLLTSKQKRYLLNDNDVLIDLVKGNMSEKRFNHSLGVAKLAKELAKYHHVNEQKAFIAGLLHDLAKEIPLEESNLYLKYFDGDKLNEPDKVKHSHVAKYYIKERLHFHDKDILNAIYNHTILKSNDKLSLILYIADKREENRKIDDEIVDVAKKDLKKAVNLLIEKWKANKEYKDGNYNSD